MEGDAACSAWLLQCLFGKQQRNDAKNEKINHLKMKRVPQMLRVSLVATMQRYSAACTLRTST
jgi:hypothetical protein